MMQKVLTFLATRMYVGTLIVFSLQGKCKQFWRLAAFQPRLRVNQQYQYQTKAPARECNSSMFNVCGVLGAGAARLSTCVTMKNVNKSNFKELKL